MNNLHCIRLALLALLLVAGRSERALGQSSASDLRIFGYFQTQFLHQNGPEEDGALNSFSLQQLNLFLQKDLGANLSSFINFEAINSFSTRDGWGSLRIEEAWVRYRRSPALNVKAGILIPTFNNFNEIKNRTPLIPYVIRPLVYEPSLAGQLNNPLWVPEQAFLQAFGWAPVGTWKFDYAGYMGNTGLVTSSLDDSTEDRRRINLATGIDSSSSVLFGLRVGLRKGEFKMGFSAASDRANLYDELLLPRHNQPEEFSNIPRYRSGFDLSFHYDQLWFEHEAIAVVTSPESEWYDLLGLHLEGARTDVQFWYMILGYRFTDRLQAYGGYQRMRQTTPRLETSLETRITIPTAGLAYSLEDQISLKAQYAYVTIDEFTQEGSLPDYSFHRATLAVSVSF